MDNWHHTRDFFNHWSNAGEGNGITFIPPTNSSSLWSIRTQWRVEDFFRILCCIRPTPKSLTRLTVYTDMFVCTQHAQGPLRGITIEGMPAGHMFMATFIHAQLVPGAFQESTQMALTQTNLTTTMEVNKTMAAVAVAPSSSQMPTHAA